MSFPKIMLVRWAEPEKLPQSNSPVAMPMEKEKVEFIKSFFKAREAFTARRSEFSDLKGGSPKLTKSTSPVVDG